MGNRKKFFDDRVWFDPTTNRILIGRPDTKTNNEPWDFFITDGKECIRSKNEPFKKWIELGREPEFSMF